MYFWQKTGFKIGIGVTVVAAIVSVTLFSDQIGNLLEMFGSKAGTGLYLTWGDNPYLWNSVGYQKGDNICFVDETFEAITLCDDSTEEPGTTDNCPNDPAKTEPGVCGCGIPDVDSDGDGVFNCNDNCPNDSAKTEPGVCGCGVLDVDSDSDGVPDCNDYYPNDPDKTELEDDDTVTEPDMTDLIITTPDNTDGTAIDPGEGDTDGDPGDGSTTTESGITAGDVGGTV